MNKKRLYLTLFLLSTIMIPQVSLASVISLRSSTKSIEPSKTFSVSVYVNPSSVTSYTAQANISFPSDLVSVESFSYASSWFPINQAGYDLIDNSTGKVVKTAGYPNGFSAETLLGTMVLKSKKAGSITISINKESYVLDVDSNNTLNSYGTFAITSTAPAVVEKTPVVTPVVTKTTTPTVKKETAPTTKVETKKEAEKTTIIPTTESTPVVSSSNSSSKITILFIKILAGALSAYLSFN